MTKFLLSLILDLTLIVIILTFSSFNCLFQNWSLGSNILIQVRAGNTASYSNGNNGWLFIISGRDQNNAIIKTVQRYNLNSDVWDTLSSHPTGLLGAATTSLKDSIYVIGGVVNPPGSGLNTVSKFSINQNQWSTVANLPITLVDAKAVSYQDSLIYTAGGFGGANTGIIYLYNSNNDTWRAATPFPSVGRRSFGGFAITGDTLVYMCGTTGFGSTLYFDSVYVGVISQVDRSIITWTTGANFPGQTRTFFDAHTWGNEIVMTGGSTDNTFNTPTNECYSFNPGTNQWTQLPDKPTAWLTGQSGTVGLSNNIWKLICASGYNNGYLSQTEIFTDTLLGVGINYNTIFSTSHNFPNPFNIFTHIRYTLKEKTFVDLKIFDSNGQQIAVLVNENQLPGSYSIKFDGDNFSNGVYYSILCIDNNKEIRKIILIK